MSQDSGNVWVFSELASLTNELLSKGRELADHIGGDLVTVEIGSTGNGQEYVERGADLVLQVADPSLSSFQIDSYTDVLTSLADEYKPDILLIGGTRSGLELAPRLAERLKTGCVTEASQLEFDAERKYLLMDRITFGGNVVETQISRAKPQIATIARGLFHPATRESPGKGKIAKVEPKYKPPTTKLLEAKQKVAKGVPLAEAEVIVSFGRGVRKKEDMAIIEQFAQSIGGVVSCSRPIAEDLGWLPEDQYIGLSGQKVSPKLYFACGISGQIQHLTGIRNSRIIVAINNDPKAPIFDSSDYKIVGDLYQVIPALTEAAKELRKHNA